MEKSFWYSEKASYPTLEGNIECDTLVIGGGVAGLSAAYELALSGQSVVLIEKGRIGQGQSGRSSAIVSFAHDLIYYRLKKNHGIDKAREYYKKNKASLERLFEIIKNEKIECSSQRLDGIFYARTQKGCRQLKKELKTYRKLGVDVKDVDALSLSIKAKAAFKLDRLGVINPYDYICGLAQAFIRHGGKVYENTEAFSKPKDGCLSEKGFSVRAKRFIIATNFPYYDIPGFYFAKLYRHRSHCMALDTSMDLSCVYEPCDNDGVEYRPIEGGGVLACGASVRTGKYKYNSYFKKLAGSIADDLYLGDLEKTQEACISEFSAQDCMSFDLLPYAGKLSMFGDDNIDVLTGFNKWGFTTSLACAKEIIEGGDGLFSPSRFKKIKAVINSVVNVGVLVGEFSDYILRLSYKKLAKIKNGQGAIIKYEGKRLGVYRDKDGSLHAVSGVCSHMGCPLKWNKDELSFDCACHGSRFDATGNILDNPANKSLERIRVE